MESSSPLEHEPVLNETKALALAASEAVSAAKKAADVAEVEYTTADKAYDRVKSGAYTDLRSILKHDRDKASEAYGKSLERLRVAEEELRKAQIREAQIYGDCAQSPD